MPLEQSKDANTWMIFFFVEVDFRRNSSASKWFIFQQGMIQKKITRTTFRNRNNCFFCCFFIEDKYRQILKSVHDYLKIFRISSGNKKTLDVIIHILSQLNSNFYWSRSTCDFDKWFIVLCAFVLLPRTQNQFKMCFYYIVFIYVLIGPLSSKNINHVFLQREI